MENKCFLCEQCNYKTNKLFNLKWHHNDLHPQNELNKNDEQNVMQNEQNIASKRQNIASKRQNIASNEQNIVSNEQNI